MLLLRNKVIGKIHKNLQQYNGVFRWAYMCELLLLPSAALSDGRLIIGVTKFDNVYEDDDPASIETVKQKIMQSVATATGISLPEDVIIPLCGKWALSNSNLIHQLNIVEDGRVLVPDDD